ncbi:MAG TPA: response regulator [Acidimicrobiales bacterium]|nr:response regulator [Acidimicrobiales bacterium]
MTSVLVVDDEPQIRRTLRSNLSARGYDVRLVATGEEALEAAADEAPDLVLLDLGLPGIDGVEVVRRLRATSGVPIVILTVRDGEADKIDALDAGADDYITKPFAIGELLARLRAALRRAAPVATRVETADFVVDLQARTVLANGTPVKLTPTEWHLVEVLTRNAGRLVTHHELLQEVWGPAYGRETNYLRVYMAQIRRKLEPEPSRPRHFITEPGVGYRFLPGD